MGVEPDVPLGARAVQSTAEFRQRCGIALATISAEQVLQRETELHHYLMGKPDAIEGVMAYLERRKARWALSAKKDFPDWPA